MCAVHTPFILYCRAIAIRAFQKGPQCFALFSAPLLLLYLNFTLSLILPAFRTFRPPPPSACLAVKPCLRGMVPPASYTSYLTQTSNSRILRLIQIAILLFFVIALTRFHFGLTLRICLKAQNKVQMPTYVLVSD